ncbi:hypothetical protein [Weissella cibaria]|uniref:Uncharacterized protein n=1 Tax=Weissella cibaria TaxID=137591 RepID=A0A2S1KV02_9LACO|nr:hypothetical protein [Weissella cibaria]AWF96832.1 hypothetical protein B6254_2488 [Weissella cibaria]
MTSWQEYRTRATTERENFDQAILSVAVEPAIKEALQQVGKKVGRNRGGSKSVLREALTEYFDKHPELFED